MTGSEFNNLAPHAEAVRTASSVEALADAIARLHRVTQPWGLWQDPHKFAACLWEVRRLCQEHKFTSFFEVGTRWGYSFFVIKTFLPGVSGMTIDDMNRVITEVAPFLGRRRAIAPVHMFANRVFDVVFFDCWKGLDRLKADYAVVGAKAKVCVFAAAGPDVQAWWKELGRPVVEFDGAGILLPLLPRLSSKK